MNCKEQAPSPVDLDTEPSFDEYVAARRVVLYEYEQLRRTGKHGKLSISRDEMVANIIFKSCERFRGPADSLRGRSSSSGNDGGGAAIITSGQDQLRKTAGGIR